MRTTRRHADLPRQQYAPVERVPLAILAYCLPLQMGAAFHLLARASLSTPLAHARSCRLASKVCIPVYEL